MQLLFTTSYEDGRHAGLPSCALERPRPERAPQRRQHRGGRGRQRGRVAQIERGAREAVEQSKLPSGCRRQPLAAELGPRELHPPRVRDRDVHAELVLAPDQNGLRERRLALQILEQDQRLLHAPQLFE